MNIGDQYSMSTILEAPIFRLGDISFRVTTCDPAYLEKLTSVLPICADGAPDQDTYDISLGCNQDLRALSNHIFKRHSGYLWINAACLQTHDGKKVLICGSPGTGKSTLSLALCLSHGWRVFSEDITLIDINGDRLVTFGSPFSVREGTSELVTNSMGVNYFVLLESPNREFEEQEISNECCLREIVKRSNCLRLEDGIAKLTSYLENATCLSMRGTGLTERVQSILRLVSR
jgi:hypothetical protein